MDPALDILDRALKGDSGALNFLERTASIYVYDNTNPTQPKICGAWDFLNQALTEVERYESRVLSQSHHNQHQQQPQNNHVNLKGHVQLLATMSRKAARRTLTSDQSLVEVCLTNAAHYHGSTDQVQHFIQTNRQMRERVMGRIAAIAFDPSHHLQRQQQQSPLSFTSAFDNHITIESLCSMVAANTISSGPNQFIELISDWIVPSKDNFPPFAVVAVTYHLALESMRDKGGGAPAGTADALKNRLFGLVISVVSAPILLESIRESDVGDRSPFGNNGGNGEKDDGGNWNHRIAAMALKTIERWAAATECNLVTIKKVCQGSNINIIEVISDALYSDSELVMGCLADLFDTLLKQHEDELKGLQGMAIASAWRQNSSPGGSGCNSALSTLSYEQDLTNLASEREGVVAELVSAIGLQRFRFNARLANGDSGVCRYLTSIAKSLSIAAQSAIRSGKLKGRENGMIELLMNASAHPSIHVCGMALEALQVLITPDSPLTFRLLPLLQGKAIIPPALVNMAPHDDFTVDFHDFERFRAFQLSDALSACYLSNRSHYIQSCASAIEEFCMSLPSPQLPFQLEAALFCLSAVSMDASKRAMLLTASPSARLAAAKASSARGFNAATVTDPAVIETDAKNHDEYLSRCIKALATNSKFPSSNSLVLAQTCRFLAKYAHWLSKTPTPDILDSAATLALNSFNSTASAVNDNTIDFDEPGFSPFTEAATALRNILSRSPQRFATAEALSALETGWRSVYSNNDPEVTKNSIDDKKALCGGIAKVLAVLPPEQWPTSFSGLASPTIQCIETVTKHSDILIENRKDESKCLAFVNRMAEEITVLATVIRTFNNATANARKASLASGVESPILPILKQVWPLLTHVTQKYSTEETISSSLSEFLLVSVSIHETAHNAVLLKDICELSVQMMNNLVQSNKPISLVQTMDFVAGAIDTHGHIADTDASATAMGNASPIEKKEVREIIESLIYRSFETIQSTLTQNSEQGIGQKPFEHSPKVEVIKETKCPEALAGLFSICIPCVQRCPVLFINLQGQSALGGDGIFSKSVETAVASVGEKEIEVSRGSILFLKEVFQLSSQGASNANSMTNADINPSQGKTDIISTQLQHVTSQIRGELILSLIHGACGFFPREVLDPAASLLYLVLRCTPSNEAGSSAIEAVQSNSFVLGDKARSSTIVTLGKCAQGTANVSKLMDLFEDLWLLHQNGQDTGTTAADGDAVVQFVQKYGL